MTADALALDTIDYSPLSLALPAAHCIKVPPPEALFHLDAF